jgi:hypothetical protein
MRLMILSFLIVVTTLAPVALAQQPDANFTLTLPATYSFTGWLSISNAPQTNFLVEVSDDLRRWKGLITVDTTKPDVVVADDSSDRTTVRFYRARVPGLSLDDQQAAWASAGLRHYQYRFTRSCFCKAAMLSGTVTVRDGVVVSVTDAFDGRLGQPIANADIAQFKSIEQLFQVIRDAKSNHADVIAVTYDLTLKYPARIALDYILLAVDEEISYEASEVVAIE